VTREFAPNRLVREPPPISFFSSVFEAFEGMAESIFDAPAFTIGCQRCRVAVVAFTNLKATGWFELIGAVAAAFNGQTAGFLLEGDLEEVPVDPNSGSLPTAAG
jgi:hypothetical protein